MDAFLFCGTDFSFFKTCQFTCIFYVRLLLLTSLWLRLCIKAKSPFLFDFENERITDLHAASVTEAIVSDSTDT